MLVVVASEVSHSKWLVAHPKSLQRDPLPNVSGVTQFRRVRVVEVVNVNNLQCSCVFFARMGLPCKHILRVTNTVTATMCHIRWAKQYLFQFGAHDHVTAMLVKMQRVGQSNAVPMPSSLQLSTYDRYPTFLHETSTEDGDTMLSLHRHTTPVPISYSLSTTFAENSFATAEKDTLTNTNVGMHEEIGFSPARVRMLSSSVDAVDDIDDYDITYDGTMKLCKSLFNIYKNQPNGVATLQQKLYNLYSEVCADIASKKPASITSNVVSTIVVCGRKKSTRIRSAGL